jgi:DnaJ-class molecular chaperone
MIEKDRQEIKCDACGGKGFPAVAQPIEPGRRIYPPPCKKCGGKGRRLRAGVEKRKGTSRIEKNFVSDKDLL